MEDDDDVDIVVEANNGDEYGGGGGESGRGVSGAGSCNVTIPGDNADIGFLFGDGSGNTATVGNGTAGTIGGTPARLAVIGGSAEG